MCSVLSEVTPYWNHFLFLAPSLPCDESQSVRHVSITWSSPYWRLRAGMLIVTFKSCSNYLPLYSRVWCCGIIKSKHLILSQFSVTEVLTPLELTVFCMLMRWLWLDEVSLDRFRMGMIVTKTYHIIRRLKISEPSLNLQAGERGYRSRLITNGQQFHQIYLQNETF